MVFLIGISFVLQCETHIIVLFSTSIKLITHTNVICISKFVYQKKEKRVAHTWSNENNSQRQEKITLHQVSYSDDEDDTETAVNCKMTAF